MTQVLIWIIVLAYLAISSNQPNNKQKKISPHKTMQTQIKVNNEMDEGNRDIKVTLLHHAMIKANNVTEGKK